MSDESRPTERKGGAAPGDSELQEKGPWAEQAREGVVPASAGGADAPESALPEDPPLGSEVTGRTPESSEPATSSGVDLSAGDSADAVTDGGADVPADAEPDLRDAASGPPQSDLESAS